MFDSSSASDETVVFVAPMKRPAAVAGVKELAFLISILPTSRVYNICRMEDAPQRKSKENAERMTWSASAWGIASVSLALMLIFPPLHSWASADTRSSFSSSSSSSSFAGPSKSVPTSSSHILRHNVLAPSAFKEAPRVRNGKYCFSSSRTPARLICDPASVHIAMTLDAAYLRGSIAAVFSVLQHASCPENVIFHFLVVENDAEFQDLVMSTFPFLRFKIYHFDSSLVRDRISSSVRQALEQPLNYARNYLSELLEPCIGRVIYLDSDLVVVDDIFKLWNTSLGSHIIGAPEYCHANFTKYFSPAFWTDPSLSSTFSGRSPCYFNTGVMIMDLEKWRSENCTRKIELWMEIQKERRIYELGSLPPFLLVFAGYVKPVEHRWNQHGLGGDNVKGSCRPLHPGPVSLLHWSGEGKPWTRLDSRQPCPLDSLWVPYDLFLNMLY